MIDEWFKIIKKDNNFDVISFDKSEAKGLDEYEVIMFVVGCLKTWKEEARK